LNEKDLFSDDTTASKSETLARTDAKKRRRKKKRRVNLKRNTVSEDELLDNDVDEVGNNKAAGKFGRAA
jgi:hypothetical protein